MATASLLTRTNEPGAPAHFRFEGIEAAPFDNRQFGVLTDTCHNPLCDCHDIHLYFFPDLRVENDNCAFAACVDAVAGIAKQKKSDIHSPAAAQLLEQQLMPHDWAALQQIWRGLKATQIESLTLSEAAKIDFVFADDDLSSMVAFEKVFSGCLWFEVQHQGQSLVTIDLYCTNPTCKCTDSVWTFFSRNDPKHPVFSIEYDYQKSQVKGDRTTDISLDAAAALIEQVREKHPDLDQKLAHRNQLLRTMRNKSLLSHPKHPSRKRMASVSRNAPCPCGSGKKYKHCCGA